MPMHKGVRVEVHGRFIFDEVKGYECLAWGQGSKGPKEYAVAHGDSVAKARTAAFDAAAEMVIKKGNK